jgi:hypothetical protein
MSLSFPKPPAVCAAHGINMEYNNDFVISFAIPTRDSVQVLASVVSAQNLINIAESPTAAQNQFWASHDRIKVFPSVPVLERRVLEYVMFHPVASYESVGRGTRL